MQVQIKALVDGFEAPAIFVRENTVRYFNQDAVVLFPGLKVGGLLPEEIYRRETPFQIERCQLDSGTLYLFHREEPCGFQELPAISRHLRNSLSVLLSAQERLHDLVYQNLFPDAAPLFDQMFQQFYILRRQCDHMDLLHMLKTHRATAFRFQEVDLAEQCFLLAELMEGMAKSIGVSFRLDCKIDTLTTRADLSMLRRMLFNLLSNAIAAARPGGSVSLKLEKTEEKKAVFTVWDSGSGKSLEELDGFFLPRRLPGEGAWRDRVGTGLRLIREIADAHGGSLMYSPGGEGGTKVVVSLPIRSSKGTTLHSYPMWEDDLRELALVEMSPVLPANAYERLGLDG